MTLPSTPSGRAPAKALVRKTGARRLTSRCACHVAPSSVASVSGSKRAALLMRQLGAPRAVAQSAINWEAHQDGRIGGEGGGLPAVRLDLATKPAASGADAR